MAGATRRILALGHRRTLSMVRERALLVTGQRMTALSPVAREAEATVTTGEASVAAAHSRRFRDPRLPTAVIVSNSIFAALTPRAIDALELDYPRSVSLLAFDAPEWADLVQPRLPVAHQPTPAIARKT